MSIFQELYSEKNVLVDKYVTDPKVGVDVIIPVKHTNELWEKNLLSYYREIPIRRLLIGDGGCVDNSIEIARKFPRVQILDHRNFVSLGYSISKLIESVESEWFVYVHSDVYLPKGWYEQMKAYQGQYDWYECRQRLTTFVEFDLDYKDIHRAMSGSQMGRKAAFKKVLPQIDDDFLYRTEDIVLAELLIKSGYKYGRVDDVFHYHEVMYKESQFLRKVKSFAFELELGRDEEIRSCMTMAKAIVKYLEPPKMISLVVENVNRLEELGAITWDEFNVWVLDTNPLWVEPIKKQRSLTTQWRLLLNSVVRKFKTLIKHK